MKKPLSISPSKYTKNRFLSSPQKEKKIRSLQSRVFQADKELARLKAKIHKSTNLNGVLVDDHLHENLRSIMDEHNDSIEQNFPEGSFQRLKNS